ncbi:MAG: hypothetical protein WC728_04640 [Elusimicrobiota bacterium]
MEERAEAERFNAELDRMLAGGEPERLTPELELAGRLCGIKPRPGLQAELKRRLLSKPGLPLQLRVAFAAAAVLLCMAYPVHRFLRRARVEPPVPTTVSAPARAEEPSELMPQGLVELSMRRMRGAGRSESPFVTAKGKKVDGRVRWDLPSVSIVLERKRITPEDFVVKASELEEWGEWEVAPCE